MGCMQVVTGRMRELPLKNKIKIHSASLFYEEGELVGYGGSDENGNFQAYLYRLRLDEGGS